MSLLIGLIVKTIDILAICPTLRRMWKETTLGNQVRLIVNGEASQLITITRGVAQDNTISPLTFAVIKETVAKWITQEYCGYYIVRIDVKGMDYMDDEVRIADILEDIHKMTTIKIEFAEWAGMRFGIHKCAYWGREFMVVKGRTLNLRPLTYAVRLLHDLKVMRPSNTWGTQSPRVGKDKSEAVATTRSERRTVRNVRRQANPCQVQGNGSTVGYPANTKATIRRKN